MNRELRQIYVDLSNGRLSQQKALEKIKAAKLRRQQTKIATLLVTPVWQAGDGEAATAVEYDERHIVLCELPEVDAGPLMARSHCLAVRADRWKSMAERYCDVALACFDRVQTILAGRAQGKMLVQIVAANDQEDVLLAGLSGLLKTAALENSQFIGQLILVPAQTTTEELTGWLETEKAYPLDPLARYGYGDRQVLRWKEIADDQDERPLAFRDDGVYLITGGLGALGLVFAGEILARTSDARVVLTGRSEWTADKQARLDELAAQAGRVSYERVDLGDLDGVKGLVAGIEDRHGQMNGIVHCAGMIADNFILKKTGAEFIRVLTPKVVGTFNLDQASQEIELDFFVLFSSFAGAMGNVGQADYATANGFMDQFAWYRNRQVAGGQRHGRTRSINWPLWQAGGMSIDPASQELLQRATGMQPMQTATGLEAFHRSLALPHDQVLVGEGDPSLMRHALLAAPVPPPEPQTKQPAPVACIDLEKLAEATQNYLRQQFSGLLKLPSHVIDPHAALEQYGIDSLLAMKLTSQLEQTFGTLSKTLFFEYQTIGALSEYFVQSHSAKLADLFPAPGKSSGNGNGNGKRTTAEPMSEMPLPAETTRSSRRVSRQRTSPPRPTGETEPIAIIGLSGRYPEAVDIGAYWKNLREGKDCIVEIPKDRWDWREYFSDDRTQAGHHYSKWGGFIEGVDEFDPLFFNISPKEAKFIDPQERLFLQHAWMAIEDAGYTRASLQAPHESDLAGQVGVYVGVMYSEYQLFGAESSVQGKRLGVAGSAASIANRVSYVLNLHGPSVTLDTMCSSSLTAIHFACLDLKLGRTTLAIAGGVNVSIHPNKYLVLSAGQFISSDGHCQSFGEGGDGYIPGEGVGAVILKRLADAKRDGDHIYGIIRGSALNHGGKTNGVTVPNPHAQASAIGRALAESQTDARHISYIEAHGTGTKLGDPIEITALSKAFRQHTQDTQFCMIGSAKSNIGHCESAAGMAGLTKVLLQMQHQEIVPSLHSAQLNPHIDFPKTPFIVNQTLRPWEQPVVDGRTLPRIAGISSFGAGGSNAHLVIEEYQSPVRQPVTLAEVAVVLSARTAEQLRQKARDLLDFVRLRADGFDLAAIAWTLQVGREAMDERLAVVVSSAEQLIDKLRAYVAGEGNVEDLYHGRVKRNGEGPSVFSTDGDLQQTIEKWIASKKLAKLLDLWVEGLDLEWSKLVGERRPQRISLPTYPFARERYWIDTAAVERVDAKSATTSVLHPLLHGNTSDLSQQSYSSTFTGEEFFLVDHQLDGRKILPAAAFLEMARAAVEKATRSSRDAVVQLRDVVWAEPAQTTQISVALSANDAGQIDFEIYSEDAGQEIVLCQGRAVSSPELNVGRLDLERLERQMGRGAIDPADLHAASARMGLVHGPAFQGITAIHRGSAELLAHLRLPTAVEETAADYVLHPSLIEGALQAAVALSDSWDEELAEPRLPLALESLSVVAPCTRDMVAWLRYAPGSHAADDVVKLDIDLCDGGGNVCAQMRGVSWQPAALEMVEPVREPEASDIQRPALLRKEIVFAPLRPLERKKRAAVALAAPGTGVSTAPSPAGRAQIALSNVADGTVASANATPVVSPIRLYDCENGIFAIEIAASRASDVIAQALQALARVQQESSLKVLMLSGIEHCFVHGGRDELNEAVERKFFQRLVSFPYPIIAIQQGDVTGAGFLAAALCDFMVCSEEAQYGYTDPQSQFYPTTAEAMLFSERFGAVLAEDLLYLSPASTGRQLHAKGWTCPIVPLAEVETRAEELASTFVTKSREALHLLKQHLTRRLAGLVDALKPVDVEPVEEPSQAPVKAVVKAVTSPSRHFDLDSPAEHVLVVRYSKPDVRELGDLFAAIHEGGDYKAIVLAGDLAGDDEQNVADDVLLELQRLIFASDIPVIGALSGDANGPAWVMNLLCDACVHSRAGAYSAAGIGPAPVATAVFTHRFGDVVGREILLTDAVYRGADLERRIGSLIVAESDQVVRAAVNVAESWTKFPRSTLASWKKRTAATIDEKTRGFAVAAGPEQADSTSAALPAEPTSIPLKSNVVTVTAHPEGIVVVKLEDRQARNMFSTDFVDGVTEAFAHIERTPAYKVVVLTGYDNYFAAGGTKESLLAIQEGKARFTDVTIFQLPLECRLPVIAAIQGHALGAGWAMGMFADFVLFSEESRYVSPYMNYGFTPGAGATWILASKIGEDLARESLFTAQYYAGSELRKRGLRLPILPRAEVVPAAMQVAREIARVPRGRLIALKQQLTGNVHEVLEETYRLELAMHEKTFVGQSDTLARIRLNFYGDIETRPAGEPATLFVQRRRAETREEAPAPAKDALPEVMVALKKLLANELQMRESDIDDHAQFIDVGLDSISGVSWIRKINERYQTSIEATKVYSYPTLTQLGRHVKEEAEKQGTLTPAAAPATVSPVSVSRSVPRKPVAAKLISRRGRQASRFVAAAPAQHSWEPIAVIGMAGRFPQARNVEQFWQNIARGKDCITQVATNRWDVNALYQPGEPVPGKTNSQWLGALDEYDRFDPLFFNISPTEAESMDPQQRLFLQACWHAIEDAGYDARWLSGSRCGVFVGCASGDYHQSSRHHQVSAQGFTGAAMSVLAARISYFLDLHGPCISIDTACSSSLVAIASACESLNSGSSDLALAGGVYVMVGPDMHIRTSQAGMLSPDGKCYAFDQRANGFVPGEGVGVVLLKRLSDAQRDKDIIHGVIQGWGINQDGKTNGITAPNPDSQARLEQGVYDKYEINPEHIQLIEAHGTGTKLGDPIEVEGLKQAFRKYTQKTDYCALGSVKSNIGHTLTAAGVAGVLKLVLALKHKQLPPTAHFERLNEHIDLSGSPFYVNGRLQEWKQKGGTRRAAISSFGFSGTNAHMVIGEYIPVAEAVPPTFVAPAIVPLSARTVDQLEQKARDLLDFIRTDAQSVALSDIAYTLQVGRQAMDERLGFVASSVAQLIEKLEAYVHGQGAIEDAYRGQAKRGKTSLTVLGRDGGLIDAVVEKCIAEKRLSTLLELWINGVELDWSRLYGEVKPRRISLPTYPFAKERYWIDAHATTSGSAAAVLHPLLHSNTSDLSGQRYSSTFTGEEVFLADHAGRKVLPAAACLEMARAAIERALPEQLESRVIELRNTVWAEPIFITDRKEVSIALSAVDDEQIDFEVYSEDVVHCQGRAVLSREPRPARLDLEQLKADRETLVTLRTADMPRDYVLHPTVMDSALQAAGGAIDGGVPSTLEKLRIVSPCTPEMVAWVRSASGGSDIDLCDSSGNICVQMRGLSWQVLRHDIGSVIATPVWQASTDRGKLEYTEHHVVLCGPTNVETLPSVECLPLQAEPGKNIAQRYSDYALACFERIRSIMQRKPRSKVLVQIVVAEDHEQVLLTGLSGLLKTAALENPQLVGQLILVSPQTTAEELSGLLEAERSPDAVVRYDDGARQVLRWQEVQADRNEPPVAFEDRGVYLITGGLGALGLLFTKEILERAPRATVVLTGRSEWTAEKEARLSGYGGRVSYRQVDLGELDQVRELIDGIQREYGRLDGILHCAGMIADNFIVKKGNVEFCDVLAPKVTGTYNLDLASRDIDLDFFALFSSIAGAVGNLGQADYAAANGFLGQFAAYRNALVAEKQRHGRTRSIHWPLWQEGGMAIDPASRELILQTIGAQPMQTTTGLQAFHRSLGLPHDEILIVEGIQSRIRAYLQEARMFEGRSTPRTAAPVRKTEAVGANQLQRELKAILSTVLRIDASLIDADQPFAEFGLDSFLGAEMIVAVNKKYGTELSHARLFDYSTVGELARFLEQEIGKLPAPAAKPLAPAERSLVPAAGSVPVLEKTVRSGRRTTRNAQPSDDKVAIIGMSGRYPKADDLNQYWRNLAEGRNAIGEVPSSRWDVDRHYDPDRTRKDKTYSKWLGALDDIDRFDPLFFRISPHEAECVDPQHRLFLQESYRAFEDAGYSTTTLSNRKCGVYLGISTNEYMTLLSRAGVLSAPVTGNSHAIAAARIAYYLNLKGPAISVDTACSSSLVAIHLACQAILNREIDMALAGGVSLWLTPDSYVAMSRAGMFSPVGQCKTFDDSADGIVNGEGVGAVVLKRLKDAEADGDEIRGVILGSGINQDGRTNGITAPSVSSQIELERSIYAKYEIDPETISYVETHGTGTKLGDPIELEALATVFRERTSRRNFCALGSVKSNIGHTTSAAGVAGLHKVLLSMRHRTLVPTLNVTTENARFDFESSPFTISRETKAWDVAPGTLRRAAVSAFGFSGTNAHLVVEEYPSPVAQVSQLPQQVIVPLSAKAPEQLRQRSLDLLDFIRAAQQPVDLAAVAYTLQIGREAMEERLAFVVSSVDQLTEKLSAYVSGERGIEGVHQGRVEPGNDGMTIIGRDGDIQEAIEKWIARKKLSTLADSWARGLNFDWNELYDGARPRRVSLPAYRFAKERCWIDGASFDPDRDDQFIADADIQSIEDIISRIAEDAIEPAHAVQALRMLV
jgi:acyl transferase domain-containing protein/enoyl-CoA hydratase/carnithine racemase/acyl carrier protein